jgi:DNA-binding FrmR family transcriptional regulator
MNKKEYLLKILTQLEPIRDLAKWLKILVWQWNLEDNILDILIDAIKWAIHTTKSELAKEKLEKWLNTLEKMKELEQESIEQDKKDLEELDNLIDSF